jgi:2-keto-4-pentenoate hydratase
MALTDTQVAKAADLLAATFQGRTTIDALPEDCSPANAVEAVQVQIGMLERLGLEASGYKAGFTNPPMLAKAGPDGPMFGVMFRDFTIVSGGSLKSSDVGPNALIEAEVSFRMGADLPARDGGYSDDEVMAAVDSAIIGIEFAVPRLNNPMGQPMVHLAADNGAAMAYAAGPDIADWQSRDLRQLEIELLFDGEVVSEGLPLPARCDERWALAQTINHFSARGVGTHAGDLITTGAAATPKPLGNASDVVARFAGIGDVHVNVEN